MNPIEWAVNTMPKTDDKNLSGHGADEDRKGKEIP